jgi:hypothetical protein
MKNVRNLLAPRQFLDTCRLLQTASAVPSALSASSALSGFDFVLFPQRLCASAVNNRVAAPLLCASVVN